MVQRAARDRGVARHRFEHSMETCPAIYKKVRQFRQHGQNTTCARGSKLHANGNRAANAGASHSGVTFELPPPFTSPASKKVRRNGKSQLGLAKLHPLGG